MAVKLDQAELTLEHTGHDNSVNGVVVFETKPSEADGSPTELLQMDVDTWQLMGYPHFVTVTVKITK